MQTLYPIKMSKISFIWSKYALTVILYSINNENFKISSEKRTQTK
jgi:hypothetical protein